MSSYVFVCKIDEYDGLVWRQNDMTAVVFVIVAIIIITIFDIAIT